MTKLLMIHPDKCTGCKNCELACSFQHTGAFKPSSSRVNVYTWEREGFAVPMMCQQCDDAACVNVCPTGAMHRSASTSGIVEWNAATCIGCRMCTQACPFGNVVWDASSSTIQKCDTCDGSPECAKMCPSAALEWVDDTISTRTRKKAYASKFKAAFQEVK